MLNKPRYAHKYAKNKKNSPCRSRTCDLIFNQKKEKRLEPIQQRSSLIHL